MAPTEPFALRAILENLNQCTGGDNKSNAILGIL